MATPVSLTTRCDIPVVDVPRKVDLGDGFPDDFMIGVGSSAFQVEGASDEGGRGDSIWDTFCRRRAVESGDKSWLRHIKGSDHYHQFETDVRIMKQLGVNSYRFTISWPRILPKGIRGKDDKEVNKEGVAFYNNLINSLKARGIEPFVTLFHWEVPQTLETNYCGFLNKRIREDFKNFADFCFNEFGDRVKHWCTINEPYMFSSGGYALGNLAPGRGYPKTKTTPAGTDKASTITKLAHTKAIGTANKFFNEITSLVQDVPATKLIGHPATEPYEVVHNLILSHLLVFELYNTKYKPTQRGKIGLTLNTDWYKPLSKNSANEEAAQRKLDFVLGWILAPVTTGEYPKSMRDYLKERLPSFTEDESKRLTNSFDFVGINYYTAYKVSDAPQLDSPNDPHFTTDPRVKMEPLGEKTTSTWVHRYGKGLQELLNVIKKKYGDPEIFVTENGVGEKGDDPDKSLTEYLSDYTRIKYHHDHLFHIREAIKQDGVNVKGYFAWSFMDSFEWASGNERYGYYFVDYENGFKRYPKKSSSWYHSILKNGLDNADQHKENGVEANQSSTKRKSNDPEVEAIEQPAAKRPSINGVVEANNAT